MSELLSDDPYHFPQELLSILVDAISAICRSKPDVLMFFRSAGVALNLFADWEAKVRTDRGSVRKSEIAHSVLVRLNERCGNDALRSRREVLRRITEIEDFSGAWPADRERAEILVVRARKIVGQKDAFTRLQQERDKERQQKANAYLEKIEAVRRRKEARESVKKKLYSLFGESDRAKRGLALEPLVNELFDCFDISIRDSFRLLGAHGEGVVEQVDGAVEIDGTVYLVEMKWREANTGPDDVAHHLSRVQSRAGAGGIFISSSQFTPSARQMLTEALRDRVHIAITLQELVGALERDTDLKVMVRERIQRAIIEKDPFAPL
jgi:restriction system protein